MAGFVYIAENDSIPGFVKIGRTARHPFARMKELQSTGVPTPFKLYTAVYSIEDDLLEKNVHQAMQHSRVSDRREFFECDPRWASGVLFEELLKQHGFYFDSKPWSGFTKEFVEEMSQRAECNPSRLTKLFRMIASDEMKAMVDRHDAYCDFMDEGSLPC